MLLLSLVLSFSVGLLEIQAWRGFTLVMLWMRPALCPFLFAFNQPGQVPLDTFSDNLCDAPAEILCGGVNLFCDVWVKSSRNLHFFRSARSWHKYSPSFHFKMFLLYTITSLYASHKSSCFVLALAVSIGYNKGM